MDKVYIESRVIDKILNHSKLDHVDSSYNKVLYFHILLSIVNDFNDWQRAYVWLYFYSSLMTGSNLLTH